jgi:hypothetical protein
VPPRTLLYLLLSLSFSAIAHGQAPPVRDVDTATHLRSEIARIEQAKPSVADQGALLFLLAKQFVQLGDTAKALSLLKQCVALDEGFDPAGSQILRPLRSSPEFNALVEDIHRRHAAVQRARIAYTITETDLFPEGLAVDPARHLFYMGSSHRKKIVIIDDKGKVSDFVKPDLYNLLGLGGIKIDSVDHSVWAASDNDHDSELLHFDEQGKLLERFSPPGAPPHVLNDLVLRGSQDIYVTDTLAQHVYRFDRREHTFTPLVLHRTLFYPNGIALTPDERTLYIADLMGVIRLDLTSNMTTEVDPGPHNTLAGNDGLYWYKNSLLGIQYGTGSFRVMRWRLSFDGRRVASSEVLEYRSALLSDPTTGAVYDGKFYFMANTGMDNLQDDKIIDSKKLEPVRIAVIPLD